MGLQVPEETIGHGGKVWLQEHEAADQISSTIRKQRDRNACAQLVFQADQDPSL